MTTVIKSQQHCCRFLTDLPAIKTPPPHVNRLLSSSTGGGWGFSEPTKVLLVAPLFVSAQHVMIIIVVVASSLGVTELWLQPTAAYVTETLACMDPYRRADRRSRDTPPTPPDAVIIECSFKKTINALQMKCDWRVRAEEQRRRDKRDTNSAGASRAAGRRHRRPED